MRTRPRSEVFRSIVVRLEPVRDLTKSVPAETFMAPRSSVIEKLAETWANMLGLERVGVDDNFFTHNYLIDLAGVGRGASHGYARLRGGSDSYDNSKPV